MKNLSNLKEVIELFLHHASGYKQLEYDIKALDVFNDESIVEKLQSSTLEPKKLKEMKTMEERKKKIEGPKVNNVRIIHIPAMTVASSHCESCKEPEEIAKGVLSDFMNSSDLCNKKPDFRIFGFNNPSEDESGAHGYEFWVSIPEDMDVPDSMTKKVFEGGLYAAHSIKWAIFMNGSHLENGCSLVKSTNMNKENP